MLYQQPQSGPINIRPTYVILHAPNTLIHGTKTLTVGTIPTQITIPQGIGFKGGYYYSSSMLFPDSAGSGNLLAACRSEHLTFVPLSNSGVDAIMSIGSNPADTGPKFILQNNNGTLRFFDGASYTDLAILTVGQLYTYSKVYTDFSPYTTSHYVNGVLVASMNSYQMGYNLTYIGSGYPGQSTNTAIMLYTGRSGVIESAQEVAAYAANPWQIFDDNEDYDIFISNSSGGPISGDGSSIGTSTVSAASQIIFASVGATSGVASVNATTSNTLSSDGLSIGLSSVNAISNNIISADGSSAASSTVTGISTDINYSIGSSTATSTVSAITNSIGKSDSSSIGISIVQAVASYIISSIGSITGISILSSSSNALVPVLGSSNAGSTVTSISNSIVQANGNSSGIGNVAGATGTAGNGNSIGSSIVNAITQYIVPAIGQSLGTSVASGSVNTATNTSGASTGQSVVQAVASLVVSTNGQAIGSSTISGLANSIVGAAGSSTAGGQTSGQEQIILGSNGSSTGLSNSSINSMSITQVYASAYGNAIVNGITVQDMHFTDKDEKLYCIFHNNGYSIEVQKPLMKVVYAS